MAQLIIIALLVVALVVLLMGFRVFFTKRWGFPSSHVDGNPALRAKGLSCHRSQHEEIVHHKNLAERLAQEADE